MLRAERRVAFGDASFKHRAVATGVSIAELG
jgi:hypothetical protein